jgi:hypothetical protein
LADFFAAFLLDFLLAFLLAFFAGAFLAFFALDAFFAFFFFFAAMSFTPWFLHSTEKLYAPSRQCASGGIVPSWICLLTPIRRNSSRLCRHLVATPSPSSGFAARGKEAVGCCWSLGGMPRSRFLDNFVIASRAFRAATIR